MLKQGYKITEIAKELNRPYGSVGSRMTILDLRIKAYTKHSKQQSVRIGKSESYFAMLKTIGSPMYRIYTILGGGEDKLWIGYQKVQDYKDEQLRRFNNIVYAKKDRIRFLNEFEKEYKNRNSAQSAIVTLMGRYEIKYYQARKVARAIKRMNQKDK